MCGALTSNCARSEKATGGVFEVVDTECVCRECVHISLAAASGCRRFRVGAVDSLRSMRPTTMRVALLLLAFVAALSVAELISDGFRDFTQDHPLIATFLTEAVLLAGVYLVIDGIIQRRETRRWSDVTSLGIRALSTRAHEPSRIVRDAVGEFAVESGRQGPDRSVTANSADYQKIVSDCAGELGDWLRDDDPLGPDVGRGP